MPAPKRIAGFFILAAITYALLIIAWPAVARAYGGAFRFAAQLIFEHNTRRASVRILALHASPGTDPKLDTQLNLANLTTNTLASHPISSRYIGYVPTVMLVALTLATPLPFARRRNALLWGLLLIHLFIALRIGLILLADFTSTALAVFSLGGFGNSALSFLAELLSVSLFGCYFGPIVIWIVVTFRKGDWELLARRGTQRT